MEGVEEVESMEIARAKGRWAGTHSTGIDDAPACTAV